MDEKSLEFEHTQLLASVGSALGSWSIVELQMAELFEKIADIASNDKPSALFEGIVSFEVRLGILDRLMEFEALDDLHKETWRRLSARLSKFYKKRHEVAHFTVIAGSPPKISPFLTMTSYGRGTHRMLSAEQIRERTEKFNELAHALQWFRNEAFRRRWPREADPLPPSVEPPIVPRLRNAASQILEGRQVPPPPSQA